MLIALNIKIVSASSILFSLISKAANFCHFKNSDIDVCCGLFLNILINVLYYNFGYIINLIVS